MANTFFGEILPISSRAVDVDDEDDDEEIYEPSRVYHLKWTDAGRKELSDSADKCVKCTKLIIADGAAASAFCEIHVMGQPVVKLADICCEVTREDSGHPQTTPKDKVVCGLYSLQRNKDVVVVCNLSIPAESSFAWTQLLFANLAQNISSVAVLSTVPGSEYKGDRDVDGDFQIPLLRALTTKHFGSTPSCPYLEHPNVISGLAAQVLTHCKLHQMSAVVYVCYIESMLFTDSRAFNLFRKALSNGPFQDTCTECTSKQERLHNLIEAPSDINPLYT